MDLTSNLIAQCRPANQFHFDAEAHDRAILRAERRRARLRGFGARLVARIGATSRYPHAIIKMAPSKRPA